jgi:DNA-directed RNA polymerase subunit L
METRGIAPLVVVVIVAAVAGGSVAAPVAVDTIDVNPDSPLYALERLGERIKRVDDVSLMKERFTEFSKMCDKGKGSQFLHIQEETETLYDKLQNTLPETKKVEVANWLQAQEVRMAKNKVQLLKEAALRLKEELKGTVAENEVAKVVEDLQQCSQEVATNTEEVQARIELLKQKVENLMTPYVARVRLQTVKALEVGKKVGDFEIAVKAEVAKVKTPPTLDFQKELSEFDTKLAEIKAKLELAPQVAGWKAAEELVREAEEHRDKALEAAEDNKVPIGLIYSAKVLLERAEKILDHAIDWENEHAENWTEYEKAENLLEQRIEKLKTENAEALSVEALKVVAENIRNIVGKTQARLREVENEHDRKLGEALTAAREGYENLRAGLADALRQWRVSRGSWWDEVKQKGYLGAVLPLKAKITGEVDAQGNLSASYSENHQVSVDTAWGTFSIVAAGQGNLQAVLSGDRITGNLTASGSRSITSRYASGNWTLNITAEVSGTVSDSMVECDVRGNGTATGTHALTTEGGEGGSLEWTQSISFDVSGKIVGNLVEGRLEGWVFLYISNINAREISITRENIGGQQQIKLPM